MKKLFVLIKKEVQELLTPQMLIPLIAVVLVFMFIGNIVGKETAKRQVAQPIEVMDLDNSATSKGVIEILKKSNFIPNVVNDGEVQKLINIAKQKNEKAVLVIPKGFEVGINNFSPQKVEIYTILKSFSLAGSISDALLKNALAIINDNLGNQLLNRSAPTVNPAIIKQPVQTNNFVVIGDKQANISAAAVAGFISSQTTFIPIVLFLVIILASQLIAVSIASEKENKTLETLLSIPVNRQFIVASKLLGAGLVALLSAVIYLFGMRYYVNGLTSVGGQQTAFDGATKAAMLQLGLTFSTADYLLLGLSLFFGILSALSVAIILGSFAEDTKSAQGVIAPLMILVLIPYFLTIFLDINSLSPALRWVIYAIPFAHPFLAAPSILLDQTQSVWLGILYMAVFFAVFVYIASRIFSSEKIFTMKLSFKKKQ